MSIDVMSAVWKHSKQREGNLLVLLAIADFADDDGYAFPGIGTIGKKSRLSHRHTQRVIKQLIEAGELEIDGKQRSHKGTHLFRVTLCHGDARVMVPTSRPSRQGDDASVLKGVTPVSPKSSINRHSKETEGAHARAKVKSSRKIPTKKAPANFELSDEMAAWCVENVPTVNVTLEYNKFMDHTFKDAKTDWLATWRNWMRRATGQGSNLLTPSNNTTFDRNAPVYKLPGSDGPCTHPKRVAAGLDDEGATTYACTYCGERV